MSNRLAGDAGDRGRDQIRADVRISDDQLAERFAAFLDETGQGKSETVRQALDEFLPSASDDGHPEPDDPTLARAYRVLRRRYDRYVMRQTASAVIAQELGQEGVSSDAVWNQILVPLRTQGWVTATMDAEYGTTYVKPTVPRSSVEPACEEASIRAD